ncbi:MAG: response regulator transcription factor [Gammaproteobacteria bacterium]|nr:response regulator transcription factor [Gammaproteobacteria bacterium]
MHTSLILKNLNLLFVDDNKRISAEIYSLFSTIFKTISLAQDANSAMKFYAENNINMIITDIEMPGMDGLSFVEKIRKMNTSIPIIILSAHSDNQYLFRAANLQIDGYIIKPLNFKKLESTLARSAERLEYLVNAINITSKVIYHPLNKTLEVDANEVSLGNKECLLLEILLNKNHRVVSKKEIHESVWPNDLMSESALKNLLGELRKKLKYDIIKNQPARGWVLNTES